MAARIEDSPQDWSASNSPERNPRQTIISSSATQPFEELYELARPIENVVLVYIDPNTEKKVQFIKVAEDDNGEPLYKYIPYAPSSYASITTIAALMSYERMENVEDYINHLSNLYEQELDNTGLEDKQSIAYKNNLQLVDTDNTRSLVTAKDVNKFRKQLKAVLFPSNFEKAVLYPSNFFYS
jgi:hypothetical protein